ncbi:YceI family protein [Flavobacteriaceae bacterium F89]|uniref:YceI family protein n=1 Tax=Cerina litoralis TaxID=2874477 RepID=A0AAE3JSS0_9FLAO|nr:YceI family protein [Cerina litoralis]MCG2462823.1 YceI family protein [Cerina litoralis]
MKTKTVWKIDPSHTEIGFKVKSMMISTVSGHFEDFAGSVEASDDNFMDANFNFTAQIGSINTNDQDRDTHLKSDDFFNAAQYPQLKFVSKSYNGDKLTGDLTIRDVTKEISLDVDYNGTVLDPYGQTKAGFEFEGTLKRKDFNLKWNAVTEAGNVVVSDKVKLVVSVQFVKRVLYNEKVTI